MATFEQRLKNIYIQNWHNSIDNNQILIFYKTLYTPAKYLDILEVRKYRHYVSSFRSSCHSLEIKRGRHIKTARSIRLCRLCGEVLPGAGADNPPGNKIFS